MLLTFHYSLYNHRGIFLGILESDRWDIDISGFFANYPLSRSNQRTFSVDKLSFLEQRKTIASGYF